MTENVTEKTETFEFKAEMKQLLHLIIHSLYTHPDIFLRELISNASDALNKVQFALLTNPDIYQADLDRKIVISGDKEARTLSITDTGIGMTRDDLIDRIGTVASSGTMQFIKELTESGKPLDGKMIGQFGVGFYSAFMVADRITLTTRSINPGDTGWQWESDGSGSFTVEACERETRGTTLTLHLKEDAESFAEPWRQKEVIRKYSNFVDFPIFVDDEQVNTVKALWQKNKSDVTDEEIVEFYKFVANAYDEPLGHLLLHIEGRVDFSALLFVPSKAPPGMFREDFEYGVHLYSNNVFIQNDCKSLLPDYLRFIKGVVDTADLPLNVSREVTQSSPVMAKTQQILTGKMLGMLKEWALDTPEKYTMFFKEFGPIFKTGLASDFANREEITELIRYESTTTERGVQTSLAAYVDRMKPGQDKIYFLMGSDRSSTEANPNLEYFKKNDLEVLLLIDPVDVFTISGLTKYKEYDIVSAEKVEIKEDAGDSSTKGITKKESKKLIDQFKSVLGDRVEDVVVSKRLVDSAATLISGESGMDAQMERMMRIMDESFSGAKKVLEINTRHPVIRNLSSMSKDAGKSELVDRTILQIFEGTQLLDGVLESPTDFVERMTAIMVAATTAGDPDTATPLAEGSETA
jgi:molecular chaperone HtpG